MTQVVAEARPESMAEVVESVVIGASTIASQVWPSQPGAPWDSDLGSHPRP